jgi:hypothetical protein
VCTGTGSARASAATGTGTQPEAKSDSDSAPEAASEVQAHWQAATSSTLAVALQFQLLHWQRGRRLPLVLAVRRRRPGPGLQP